MLILAAGTTFSGQKPAGYPQRVDEFAQHRLGGIRHRSAAVTADSGFVTGHSGIVTANSGHSQKTVTFTPESPVTFARNPRSRWTGIAGHDGPE